MKRASRSAVGGTPSGKGHAGFAAAVFVLVSLGVGLTTGPVDAQAPDASALDAARVEVFFDEEWRETLSRDAVVPGAVVTVVHGGAIVLNKGYGVSDVDTGKATDADETRIRIGSVSKLFTALTALALVDAGKLDLDRDVNAYLTAVRVPSSFREPVTVRALLSHRGGLGLETWGYMSFDNNDIVLPTDVHERLLIRVRPPQREYGYDNLGGGLLGYVAGATNGTSFARAVEEHVTAPLGLAKTTMGVPDAQLEKLAACHTWDSAGALVKCVPKFMHEAFQGAGDITTTGSDMARFMVALLDNGCVDDRCVLARDTFEQFTDLDMNRLHPLGQGMGFIIYEKSRAGRLAMGHDGGQDGFNSSLILFPDTRSGVFMSLFSFVGIPTDLNLSQTFDLAVRRGRHDLYGATAEVERRFAETFLPESPSRNPASLPPVAADIDLPFLDGIYVPTQDVGVQLALRFGRRTEGFAVDVSDRGVRVGDEGPFVHTGGGVLATRDGEARWLFTRTEHDLFLQRPSDPPFRMYVKKPWHWNWTVTVAPLVLPILLAIPALLFGVLNRRSAPRRRFGYLLAFAGAAVVVGLYFELEYFSVSYYPEGATAALVAWRLVLSLAWLAAAAAVWTLAVHPRELLGGGAGISAAARALFVALLTVSALTLAILLPYWRLVGNLVGV